MPTINTLKRNIKKSTNHNQTDMRKLRQQAYQSTQWRKLRNIFMKEHPICADCLSKGKITPAVDIHHDKSPFKNGEINWNLLLDYDNLVPLCKECHALRHNKDNGFKTAEEIIKQLEMLLDDNIPDEYFDE